MVKHIASLGNVIQRENIDTKNIEEAPAFTVELHNRLPANRDIDLQFELGPDDYNSMFKKQLEFGSMEEMDACKNLLMEVKRLEDMDKEYVVLNSPFTSTFTILIDKGESQYYKFPDLKSYEHMVDILKWITKQESYF